MMIADLKVRQAAAADAPAMVELLRQSLDPATIDLTIYRCPGVTRYVERVASYGTLSGTVYLLAETANDLVGLVELRCTDRDLFVSYICARADRRSEGVGTSLLRAGLSLGRYP